MIKKTDVSLFDYIISYCTMCLYPLKTYRDLEQQRNREELVKDENGVLLIPLDTEKGKRLLSIPESILVSWFFAAIYSFYQVLWILLGLKFIDFHHSEGVLTFLGEVFDLNFKAFSTGLSLMWILFQFIIFPLFIWLFVRFWSTMSYVIAQLINLEISDNQEKLRMRIEEVLSQSLSSHTLLIIPIFGRVLSFFLGIFYIFIGLKYNLKMSSFQAISVVVAPLIFFGLVVGLFVTSFVLLLTAL